jgi:hypothetical protein
MSERRIRPLVPSHRKVFRRKTFRRVASVPERNCSPIRRNRKIFRRSQAFRRSAKALLLANKTYVRGNNSKKKIEQADFPAEAPESSCHKRETANAERSLHDLSSESSKECSLAEISESCDPAKNDRGSNQEKKHSAPTSYSKKVIVLSRFLRRQQALCQNAKFSDPIESRAEREQLCCFCSPQGNDKMI